MVAMKKIKLRSWDHRAKKMYFADAIANDIDGDKYHIMQYTGLKDTTGKEVYEGDIIDDGSWSYTNDKGEFVRDEKSNLPIEWKDELAAFGVGDQILAEYIERQKGDGITVVGNIYENPELLK